MAMTSATPKRMASMTRLCMVVVEGGGWVRGEEGQGQVDRWGLEATTAATTNGTQRVDLQEKVVDVSHKDQDGQQ